MIERSSPRSIYRGIAIRDIKDTRDNRAIGCTVAEQVPKAKGCGVERQSTTCNESSRRGAQRQEARDESSEKSPRRIVVQRTGRNAVLRISPPVSHSQVRRPGTRALVLSRTVFFFSLSLSLSGSFSGARLRCSDAEGRRPSSADCFSHPPRLSC